ncbi:MAG TPA: histidine phosphotransferase family protein [Azospirillaceae bacterium]|nr:histidine phosphotransferase family protein [Azospirillaceae bacterium]
MRDPARQPPLPSHEAQLRVTELVASRICHDLLSPVTAIGNGVELIEEMGDAFGDEALGLIASSARVAARRLDMFRFAYGAAGQSVSMGDAGPVAERYFAETRVALQWGPTPDLPEGAARLALLMLLLAEEALPSGGSLRVGGMGRGLSVLATGRKAGLRPEVETAALGGASDEPLSPRSILGFLVGQVASAVRADLVIERSEPDAIRIAAVFPTPG